MSRPRYVRRPHRAEQESFEYTRAYRDELSPWWHVLYAVLIVVAVFAVASIAHAQEAPSVDIGDAVACLRVAGCTARPQLLTDLQSAAADAGEDPVDVLGALNTLADAGIETTASDYLAIPGAASPSGAPVAEGRTPPPPTLGAGFTTRVRLTYYLESGLTYSGGRTYPGSAACSWNFPLGTRFRLPSGELFTCNDRGQLGNAPGWLDIWRRPDLAARYGPFVTVEVLP